MNQPLFLTDFVTEKQKKKYVTILQSASLLNLVSLLLAIKSITLVVFYDYYNVYITMRFYTKSKTKLVIVTALLHTLAANSRTTRLENRWKMSRTNCASRNLEHVRLKVCIFANADGVNSIRKTKFYVTEKTFWKSDLFIVGLWAKKNQQTV